MGASGDAPLGRLWHWWPCLSLCPISSLPREAKNSPTPTHARTRVCKPRSFKTVCSIGTQHVEGTSYSPVTEEPHRTTRFLRIWLLRSPCCVVRKATTNPSVPLWIQLRAEAWEKQWGLAKCVGPCHPCRKPVSGSWLQPLRPMDNLQSLSPCLNTALSNK